MGRWLQDLKFGARFLAKHPGFTAVVVLTLGLGIGASTAIYSVFHRVLLEPLPYEDPEQLVLIRHDVSAAGLVDLPLPLADVMDLRQQVSVFEGVAATDRTFERNLTGDGPPEVVRVATVTANFFDVLGVSPALGRTFKYVDESRALAPDGGVDSRTMPNVVIDHGLWQRRYGEDPSAVGSVITIDEQPMRVIGVLERGFQLHMPANAGMSTDIDVWFPIQGDGTLTRSSPVANRRVIARMLPGVTLDEAQRQADAVAAWQRETFDYHRNADIRITVTPMRAAIVGHVRPILIGLFVAVGIVLLIACANVANLLLVQAMSREREIAIRAAVGGGRRRILGQLMTESLLLSAIGGLAGLLIARWGIDLLLAARPANLPRLEDVPIDGWALAFTAGLTLVSAFLFGALPALQASRTNLHGSLNDRGVRTVDRKRRGFRGALVAGEVALAMVLLVGAGLMFRSLQQLDSAELGFDAEPVLTFRATLPIPRYDGVGKRATFHEKLVDRMEELPGVATVGATSVLPLGGQFWTSPYEVEDEAGDRVAREANYQFVTPGFFDALGIDLVTGRLLTEEDERKRKDVVVVDRQLAAVTWPGRSPIGNKLFAESPLDGNARWFQVVGVVESVRLDDPRSAGRETIFFPYSSQTAYPSMTVVVRADGVPPESLAGDVYDVVAGLDADLPISGVRPMRAYVSDATAPTRVATLLIGLFALVALVLAAIGVYGVVSSMVRQRTREIGLCLALGAPHPRIVRSVVGRGVRLGLIGLGAGLLGSLALARLTSSLVVGVSATDPLTYAAVGALLVGVTVLASLLPARRAVQVNPMDALRYE